MTSSESHRIRKYTPADRESVRAICFETGFMGSSVDFLYRDRSSFADMFSGYYTDREPEHAWVVERCSDGTVVGYLLGCSDSRRAWNPAWVAARHVLLRGLLFRRGTASFYARVIADVVRDRGVHRPPIDFRRYPAHHHIDVLPEARRGFGLRMHRAWLDHLRAQGVPGVHAEIIAENGHALAITDRLGYARHGAPYPLPGMRDREGRRLHGQFVTMDLAPKAVSVGVPGELSPGSIEGAP